MTAYEIVVFLLLIWVVREIALGIIYRRSHARYKKLRKTEETRGYFAELRNELLMAMREGLIDPNSYTFRVFYTLQTLIMRNPSKYTKISELVVDKILEDEDRDCTLCDLDDKLENEAKTWNETIKRLSKRTGYGLVVIVLNHLKMFNFLNKYDDKKEKGIVSLTMIFNNLLVRLAYTYYSRYAESKSPEFRAIRRAGEGLAYLSSGSDTLMPVW